MGVPTGHPQHHTRLTLPQMGGRGLFSRLVPCPCFRGAPGVKKEFLEKKILGVKFSGGKGGLWRGRCYRLHFFARRGSIQGSIPAIPTESGLDSALLGV